MALRPLREKNASPIAVYMLGSFRETPPHFLPKTYICS